MKTNFFIPILLFLAFVSCKKNDAEVEDPAENSGTSEFSLSNCFGQISFMEYYKIGGGAQGVTKTPLVAVFFNVASNDLRAKSLDAGQVVVNGTVLKINNGALGSKKYSDTTSQLVSLSEFSLSTSGSSSIPAFNFQYKLGTPVFKDTSSVPSIVKRSEGIHLILKEVSNADSLVFSISRIGLFGDLSKQIATFGKTEAKVDIESDELRTFMGDDGEGYINVKIFKKVLVRSAKRDYFVYSQKVYSRKFLLSYF